MATYNHAPYLRAAIDSVLSQRTSFPCRLVIGDDCSADGAQEIVREYAKRYPDRVQPILSAEHVGILSEKRVGLAVLRRCTAPYLALLDGDDYWTDPLKLQKQVDYLEAHPDCAMSFHWSQILEDSTGRILESRVGPEFLRAEFTLDDLLEGPGFISTNSVLYRNLLRGNLPAWFHRVPMGDYVLHVLHAARGKVAFMDETMAVYRKHEGGFWSSRTRRKQVADTVKAYRYLGRELRLTRIPSFRRGLARLYLQLSGVLRAEGHQLRAVAAATRATCLAPADLHSAAVAELTSSLPWSPRIGLSRLLRPRGQP